MQFHLLLKLVEPDMFVDMISIRNYFLFSSLIFISNSNQHVSISKQNKMVDAERQLDILRYGSQNTVPILITCNCSNNLGQEVDRIISEVNKCFSVTCLSNGLIKPFDDFAKLTCVAFWFKRPG